jgi:hypothetical protein
VAVTSRSRTRSQRRNDLCCLRWGELFVMLCFLLHLVIPRSLPFSLYSFLFLSSSLVVLSSAARPDSTRRACVQGGERCRCRCLLCSTSPRISFFLAKKKK